MYWPSTSSDGEFVFQHRDGEEIDADAVLARYKDWHDTSEYPGHHFLLQISWKNIFPKVSKDNSDLVRTDRLCGTDASSV